MQSMICTPLMLNSLIAAMDRGVMRFWLVRSVPSKSNAINFGRTFIIAKICDRYSDGPRISGIALSAILI